MHATSGSHPGRGPGAATPGVDQEIDLPPPMYEDNYEGMRGICALEAGFQEMLLRTEGWAWTMEAKNKTGWVRGGKCACMRVHVCEM